MESTPIIIDADTGIDDAIAIALACLSPDAELLAVSTLAGNTTVKNATANSLDVLHLMGRSDVPVHRGASRPLARPLVQAGHVHHQNGIGGAEFAKSPASEGADRGPAAIIRMARARPGELTLVCVGPLTNLAIALNVEPSLPSLLKRVVVMGGAYYVPGNVTSTAEFNFYCDPEAANQIFSTTFPDLIAVGLDVSTMVALSRRLWEQSKTVQTAPARLVANLLEDTFANQGKDGFYIHDALAVGIALDPGLVDVQRSGVVLDAGQDERGASRPVQLANVSIAVDVNQERFLKRFCDLFGLEYAGEEPGDGNIV